MGASAVSPHEARRDATCHGKVLARQQCLDSAPVSCTSQGKATRVALEGRRCSPASSPLALGGPRASLGRTAGFGACQAFFTFFTARSTFSFTFSATRSTLSFTFPTT